MKISMIKRRKMHNVILINFARFIFTIAVICFCMLDSEKWWLFLIVAGVCIAYLSLYYYANKDYDGNII